jgi:hypothetical protein
VAPLLLCRPGAHCAVTIACVVDRGEVLPVALVLADTVVPTRRPPPADGAAPVAPGPTKPEPLVLSAPVNELDVKFYVERDEDGLEEAVLAAAARASMDVAATSRRPDGITLPPIYIPVPSCGNVVLAPGVTGWQPQAAITFDLEGRDLSPAEMSVIDFIATLSTDLIVDTEGTYRENEPSLYGSQSLHR